MPLRTLQQALEALLEAARPNPLHVYLKLYGRQSDDLVQLLEVNDDYIKTCCACQGEKLVSLSEVAWVQEIGDRMPHKISV